MAKDGSQRDPYAPNSRMGGSIDEAIDEEGEEDEMDIMSYGQAVDDDLDEPGDLSLPVGVVLLMVDPETLRFELLQLDFETPVAAKVQDVLEQARDSVSEPALKGLDFHAVVDRKGNQFSAAAPLTKALTNRKRSRDILVGLSRGVSVEKCGRLARPILGDAKVILMVRNWNDANRIHCYFLNIQTYTSHSFNVDFGFSLKQTGTMSKAGPRTRRKNLNSRIRNRTRLPLPNENDNFES
jgi:hypothetical protein